MYFLKFTAGFTDTINLSNVLRLFQSFRLQNPENFGIRTLITSWMIRYIVVYSIQEKTHIFKINYEGLRSEVTFITPRRIVSILFLKVYKIQPTYTMKFSFYNIICFSRDTHRFSLCYC